MVRGGLPVWRACCRGEVEESVRSIVYGGKVRTRRIRIGGRLRPGVMGGCAGRGAVEVRVVVAGGGAKDGVHGGRGEGEDVRMVVVVVVGKKVVKVHWEGGSAED